MAKVNRRHFFAGTTASLLAFQAGCSRQSDDYALAKNINEQKAKRHSHLEALQKISANAQFTTPQNAVNLIKDLPELKTVAKISLRLHPRYSDEPNVNESKLGGQILWPKKELWPVDKKTKLNYQPILQLKLEDAPPQVQFLPGHDLLQVLWLPQVELKPIIVWRRMADFKDLNDLLPPPDISQVLLDLVPVPCRLFFERVMELPNFDLLPGIQREKLETNLELKDKYQQLCSVEGSKVGGYCPTGKTTERKDFPVSGDKLGTVARSCNKCNRGMDYLLTISSKEWQTTNWRPTEEKDDLNMNHHGLNFPDKKTNVNIFICRRCEHWPIAFILN